MGWRAGGRLADGRTGGRTDWQADGQRAGGRTDGQTVDGQAGGREDAAEMRILEAQHGTGTAWDRSILDTMFHVNTPGRSMARERASAGQDGVFGEYSKYAVKLLKERWA